MPRWLIGAALAALAALAAIAGMPAAALEVVYVTRHAQKQDPWPSERDRMRPLTDKGRRCAAARADWLRDKVENDPANWQAIADVYATDYVRTRATGAAVIDVFPGAELTGDDATARPSQAWVARLLDEHANEPAILVVGHSNTVDDLVLAFRPGTQGCLRDLALSQPEIPESQYGDLWIVELAGEGCDGLSHEPPLVLGRRDRNNCATQ